MIRITKKNDFRLTLSAYCMVGGEKVGVDLREVEIDTVDLPGVQASAVAWSVDGSGKLVLDIDGPQLDTRGYGLAVMGTVGGRDWHWAVRRIFEVVRYTAESNTTDEASLDVLCEPAGVSVAVLAARCMTEEEYEQLEEKDSNTIYITPN